MKKDHTFLLSIEGEAKLAIAFYDSFKSDRQTAKAEIERVLSRKEITSYQLNYLGMLDYNNMDTEISKQLHYFDKCGNVWLLR